jgi:hypothetical protein
MCGIAKPLLSPFSLLCILKFLVPLFGAMNEIQEKRPNGQREK